MGPQAVGGDVDVGLLPKGHPDARAPCVGEMHTVDRLPLYAFEYQRRDAIAGVADP